MLPVRVLGPAAEGPARDPPRPSVRIPGLVRPHGPGRQSVLRARQHRRPARQRGAPKPGGSRSQAHGHHGPEFRRLAEHVRFPAHFRRLAEHVRFPAQFRRLAEHVRFPAQFRCQAERVRFPAFFAVRQNECVFRLIFAVRQNECVFRLHAAVMQIAATPYPPHLHSQGKKEKARLPMSGTAIAGLQPTSQPPHVAFGRMCSASMQLVATCLAPASL